MTATGYTGSTGVSHYLEFDQTTPSSNWTITHNFGVRPAVDVLDDTDVLVLITVTHLSTNQINLTFPAPFAGKAVLTA